MTRAFIQGKTVSGTSAEVSLTVVTDTEKYPLLVHVSLDDPTPLATLAAAVRGEDSKTPSRKSTLNLIVEGAEVDLALPIVVTTPPSADETAVKNFSTALNALRLTKAHTALDPSLEAQYQGASKTAQARMDQLLGAF